MKTYILIFFILLASIVVTLKLITSQGPARPPEIPIATKRYDTKRSTYQNSDGAYYQQSTNEEIDDRKLLAFASAFVEVQSYMNKAGNNTSYKATSKIVQSHGLSVKDYTEIASRMNKNSDFQIKVQEMINEAN